MNPPSEPDNLAINGLDGLLIEILKKRGLLGDNASPEEINVAMEQPLGGPKKTSCRFSPSSYKKNNEGK